jgi:hypothetical protein
VATTERLQRSAEPLTAHAEPPASASGEGDDLDNPEGVNWRPRWLVEVGHGCHLGLATEDGCFVVLYPGKNGTWRPGKRVPRPVAERMAQLAGSGVLG